MNDKYEIKHYKNELVYVKYETVILKIDYLLNLKNWKTLNIMKTIFRFSVLFLFIGFYSCDKEAITDDNSIIQNDKSFEAQVTFSETEYRRETGMQWASFLVAQTILRNPSAEEFFMNTLSNSPQTNVVKLRRLLGDKYNDNAVFVEAFKLEFLYYANTHACRFGDDPDGVPTNNNKPPSHMAMDIEDLYVYSLLNDIEEFEFELYLPNGYTTNTIEANQITSSAYSLGISTENTQGYIHFGRCNTLGVNVTPHYTGNLIIMQYRD